LVSQTSFWRATQLRSHLRTASRLYQAVRDLESNEMEVSSSTYPQRPQCTHKTTILDRLDSSRCFVHDLFHVDVKSCIYDSTLGHQLLEHSIFGLWLQAHRYNRSHRSSLERRLECQFEHSEVLLENRSSVWQILHDQIKSLSTDSRIWKLVFSWARMEIR